MVNAIPRKTANRAEVLIDWLTNKNAMDFPLAIAESTSPWIFYVSFRPNLQSGRLRNLSSGKILFEVPGHGQYQTGSTTAGIGINRERVWTFPAHHSTFVEDLCMANDGSPTR